MTTSVRGVLNRVGTFAGLLRRDDILQQKAESDDKPVEVSL